MVDVAFGGYLHIKKSETRHGFIELLVELGGFTGVTQQYDAHHVAFGTNDKTG